MFQKKLLDWCSRFSSFSFLTNNNYRQQHNQAEIIAAAGAKHLLECKAGQGFKQLHEFLKLHEGSYLFGHAGYGMTQEALEIKVSSLNGENFEDACFYVPQYVFELKENSLTIYAGSEHEAIKIFNAVSSIQLVGNAAFSCTPVPLLSREEYIDRINALLKHIQRGDCYEINFCQQFVARNCNVNPVALFNQLNETSPNPFAACYRQKNNWLMCASPERYMQKQGSQLISQPIKGTIRRDADNLADELLRQTLEESAKDKAENVMVVDLVRNDLSTVCEPGSVKVSELYGIYSFPQVHQMISTVTGQLKQDLSLAEVLNKTFPMGSMTGAPKKRVAELIEAYEPGARGIYSGTVGYLKPSGDFDMNVVIRSIVYNDQSKQLHFHVGGGITAYSTPEKEYEECLLKASAMMQILG